MMRIRWRLITAIALGFWVWYVGPGLFATEPTCNPLKLETCER
jgi:hypothetical protein